MSGQLAFGAFPSPTDSTSICYEYGREDKVDYNYSGDSIEYEEYF